jgi:MYXO-CTERM domain-containing protein
MSARGEARLVVAVLLVTGVLAVAPAPAAAYCRLTTGMPRPGETCSESGEELHWNRQCLSYSPVARSEDEPPFAGIEQAIADSFRAWLAVECEGEPIALAIAPTEKQVRCDEAQHNSGAGNANVIAFVSDWEDREYPPEAFGLTLVWHDPKTGEILDADMMINETMGELMLCPLDDCPADAVDVQNVITHEAGHFLGLGHSYSRTSAMFFEARTGEVRKRFLNADDEAGLCDIYGELEAPECADADFAPLGGLRSSCLHEDGCSVAGGRAPGSAPLLVMAALLALRRRSRGIRRLPRETKAP